MVEHTSGFSMSDIERLAAPLAVKTRRMANGLGLVLAAGGIICVSVVGAAMIFSPAPGENLHDNAVTLAAFWVGIGLVPALAVRALILRDLKSVPRLLRNGQLYDGKIESHTIGPTGIHHVRVSWQEDGHQRGAHLDVLRLPEFNPRAVKIVCERKKSRLGVVLDERLHIAVRNSRNITLSRDAD